MRTKEEINNRIKYWECECCGLLISIPHQDNASNYDCPACKISKCEHGGKFVEISLQDFCKRINIAGQNEH